VIDYISWTSQNLTWTQNIEAGQKAILGVVLKAKELVLYGICRIWLELEVRLLVGFG